MARVALDRYKHINNTRQDEWQFTTEVKIIEKFQKRLASNTVNLRLFKSAQNCIRFESQQRTTALAPPIPRFEP
ncbi:hypothetical protein A2707_03370 [Candidatus Saccharibacteria bacterium RIFCSPHIGHO2_01_FULL_45_15]|nr:MAG: hypothetical protein A2707_03370 [Candidatus Saccharibacteria bacterium RIFCSPHIGHO2_01_FULL_45_15]OGL27258.1 MAG: hypothetical protein A3C39_04560 [Candidatus Saccharibacteria bacterium RIFCSPHIGHO2_02_FULL_46_12]OGL32461.1 MAG: hypothetical protein A3E76_00200 [Candidatus Saccharibacteria bacterium RIFCSPHIGHO2_12_FULL_44_22]